MKRPSVEGDGSERWRLNPKREKERKRESKRVRKMSLSVEVRIRGWEVAVFQRE